MIVIWSHASVLLSIFLIVFPRAPPCLQKLLKNPISPSTRKKDVIGVVYWPRLPNFVQERLKICIAAQELVNETINLTLFSNQPGTQTADERRCKALTIYPAPGWEYCLDLRTMGQNVLGLTHVKTFFARGRGPKVTIRWLKAGLSVAALIYLKKVHLRVSIQGTYPLVSGLEFSFSSSSSLSVNTRYSSVRLSIGIPFFSEDDYLGFSHPVPVCFTSFQQSICKKRRNIIYVSDSGMSSFSSLS